MHREQGRAGMLRRQVLGPQLWAHARLPAAMECRLLTLIG